jgi:hypothetical protein
MAVTPPPEIAIQANAYFGCLRSACNYWTYLQRLTRSLLWLELTSAIITRMLLGFAAFVARTKPRGRKPIGEQHGG